MKVAVFAIAVALFLNGPVAFAQAVDPPRAVMDTWQTMAQPCGEDPAGGHGREESGGMPEGWADRICDTPSNLTGPVTLATGTSPSASNPVWDGSAYGIALQNYSGAYNQIFFTRVAADGTVLIPAVQITSESNHCWEPSLVWTGTEYGLAWQDYRDGNWEIYFCRLDTAGGKIGPDLRVTTSTTSGYTASLVWAGTQFGVVWIESLPVTGSDVLFHRISAAGEMIGSKLAVTSDLSASSDPCLVWNGTEFAVAWHDNRSTTVDIYFARISAIGEIIGTDIQVTDDASWSLYPSLAWNGSGYGVAWQDGRDGPWTAYFALLDETGAKIVGDVPLQECLAVPRLIWTGSEYGVAWTEDSIGHEEVYLARVNTAGEQVGAEIRLTFGTDDASFPELAFGTLGYGVVYSYQLAPKAAIFSGIGCHADATPPSCPMGTAITGNSSFGVTLSWLQGGADEQTEIAYHRIYRDGAAIGTTLTNTYTDSPRPSGTPSYWVVAVSARGWESTECDILTAPVPEGDCGEDWTGSALVSSSSASAAAPAIAWDGLAYGVSWSDNRSGGYEIYFARMATDGTVLVPAVRVTDAINSRYVPSIVWTGTEYGLAWEDWRAGNWDIYFVRITKDGGVGAELQVTTGTSDSLYPSLTWTGAEYGLAWQDTVTTVQDIYFERITAAGAPVTPATQVTSDAASSGYPSVVWANGEYGVAWEDNRDTDINVFFARLDSAGALVAGSEIRVTANDTANSRYPSLTWTGTQYGVAYQDYRNTAADIYFSRISSAGDEVGDDIRVTTDTLYSWDPALVWTGSEYGVAWYDNRTGNYDIFYATLGADGYKLGEDRRLTTSSGSDQTPALAVGGHGLGLVYRIDDTTDDVRFIGLGCGAPDTTPPPCPSQPVETARTPASVTLTWVPSYETESDFGHYAIYRDGSPYAATLNTTWTDTAFDPAAGYAYHVQATNAAGYASGGCPSVDTADRVQPSCVGGLYASAVSSTSATLRWLPAWDDRSGVKQYNVYRNGALRGTVPVGTNTYTDSLTPGSTYRFLVESQDYANNTNAACSMLWIYSGTIALKMTKNIDGVNANLDWNDVGITDYVVYRSDSPQIGVEHQRVSVSETMDPVLQDGQDLWFYIIQQRE
jgi:hypothetical protein